MRLTSKGLWFDLLVWTQVKAFIAHTRPNLIFQVFCVYAFYSWLIVTRVEAMSAIFTEQYGGLMSLYVQYTSA